MSGARKCGCGCGRVVGEQVDLFRRRKRADAVYASSACRQRAYRQRRKVMVRELYERGIPPDGNGRE